MPLQFVLSNLLLIAAGAIIFVFIRTLPHIETKEVVKRGVFERWITSEFPERLDQFTSGLFMRTLRKIKVLVLKLDNALNKKMETLKLESGQAFGNVQKPNLQALTKDEKVTEEEAASD
jgi:hypothetical protein